MTKYRCGKTKGQSLCPNACNAVADWNGDAVAYWCGDNLQDAKGRVEYTSNASGDTVYKGCAFVRRKPDKIASRCRKGNIAIACRKTCLGLI